VVRAIARKPRTRPWCTRGYHTLSLHSLSNQQFVQLRGELITICSVSNGRLECFKGSLRGTNRLDYQLLLDEALYLWKTQGLHAELSRCRIR